MFQRFPLTLGLCLGIALGAGLATGQAILRGNSPAAPVSVPKDLVSYRDVVKQVLPAVVSIKAKPKTAFAKARVHAPNQLPPGLPDEFRKKLEEFQQQPFDMPAPSHAFGSGFLVDAKGLILTNDHVVRGADQVQVTLNDGRVFVSRDIKRDPKTDLALVRIDAKEALPYLEMGDADAMEIGDRVLAVGAPLGLTGTVTSGIVSAKGRDIHMNMYEDFVQTDAAINPGNSGGPLVNLAGQVIGVNSAIKSETGGFQGIGLAVSSNLAKSVMDQLQKDGKVHRGYLGVQVQRLDPEVATRLGAKDGGVVISKVTDGTPAARAGLYDGDIVTAVAGKSVKDARDLQRLIAALPHSKSVDLTIVRDGATKTVPVTIQEQPQSFAAGAGPGSLSADPDGVDLSKIGVKIQNATPEMAKQFGFANGMEGVLITEVDPNSMAAEVGLRSGTLIVKVDRQAVKNVDDAQKAVERGSLEKGILFEVKTAQGGTTYVLMKAPPAK